MADDILPNRVPRAQAIRELVGLDGKLPDRPTDQFHKYKPLVGRIMDLGDGNKIHIITYTTEADREIIDRRGNIITYGERWLQTLLPVTDEKHLQEIARSMSEVEQCANVRFEKVSPHDRNEAQIRIFICTDEPPPNLKDNTKTILGYTVEDKRDRSWRAIVIRDCEFVDNFSHELGHALGLTHPDSLNEKSTLAKAEGEDTELVNNGCSKKYSTMGTVMSYNTVSFAPHYRREFGPYDIAALQYQYGKNPTFDKDTLDMSKKLPPVVQYETPSEYEGILLDYRNASLEGTTVMLPSVDDGSGEKGVRIFLGSRLAHGTNITDVTFKGNPHPIQIYGNELPNVLKGGSKNNLLASLGDHDVLIGDSNAESTVFKIEHNSRNNTIKQFTPGKDRIWVSEATHRISLAHEQRKDTGTHVTAYDANNEVISSAFVQSSAPQDIMSAITTFNGYHRPITITTSKDQPAMAHADPISKQRYLVENIGEPEEPFTPPPSIAVKPTPQKQK